MTETHRPQPTLAPSGPVLVVWCGEYGTLVSWHADEAAARRAVEDDAAEWADGEPGTVQWATDDNGNPRAEYADDQAWATLMVGCTPEQAGIAP